jgi:hypothetical protein
VTERILRLHEGTLVDGQNASDVSTSDEIAPGGTE